jgi:C4-dicarboxylate-specific signal transduction histidine kinase
LNAIDAVQDKHPGGGGKVDISVSSTASDLKIVVSDNGPGVPIGDRNKIFDPFFSTKAPGKGEGLGLFIIWNLLKMIGGKIHIDSLYKQGARFVVTMPRSLAKSVEVQS